MYNFSKLRPAIIRRRFDTHNCSRAEVFTQDNYRWCTAYSGNLKQGAACNLRLTQEVKPCVEICQLKYLWCQEVWLDHQRRFLWLYELCVCVCVCVCVVRGGVEINGRWKSYKGKTNWHQNGSYTFSNLISLIQKICWLSTRWTKKLQTHNFGV